jgi:hypothetical protein
LIRKAANPRKWSDFNVLYGGVTCNEKGDGPGGNTAEDSNFNERR